MKIGIIGAGIAGLACAHALAASGYSVAVFDKGRGPGGRMSSRRTATSAGDAAFDHGAQYIIASDPAFAAQLEEWEAAGVAGRWTAAGPDCWVGAPAMNAIPKYLASGVDVTADTFIRGLTRDTTGWRLLHEQGAFGPFDGVVVALPAEQAASLLGLHDLLMAREAVAVPSHPCWAAMLAFAEAIDAPPVIRDSGIIAWAAANRSKPGRQGPDAWTVHATADWSRRHLEENAGQVASMLTEALAHACGHALPALLSITAHRWRFALPTAGGRRALWNPECRIGACGDWLLGPTVEAAWLSGRHLAGLILEARD